MFGYEPKGRGFESLTARQEKEICFCVSLFSFCNGRDSNPERAGGVKIQSGGLFLADCSAAAMPQGVKAPQAILSLTARQNENPVDYCRQDFCFVLFIFQYSIFIIHSTGFLMNNE